MEWTPKIFETLLADFLNQGDPTDPKEIKRQNIVTAATDHFIRFGYRKTNIGEVAKQAGVAKGTVYLYFASKQDLLAYSIAAEKKRYMGAVKAILSPNTPPKNRLYRWIKMVFEIAPQMPLTSRVLSGDPDMLNAVLAFMDAHKEQQFAEMQHGFIRWLVGEAAGKTVSKEVIRMRSSMLHTLAYFAGMGADEKIRMGISIKQFAATLADMLVNGVSATTSDALLDTEEE